MKKIFSFLTAILFITNVFAFSGGSFTKKASEIYLPIGKNMQISLSDLSIIKEKDFEKLTGKHLNFFDRIKFKISQRKLRNSIAADGTITDKKLLKAIIDQDGYGFNLGWFVLGLLLGLIGVLLSYLINGDEDVKRNRHKWAWIGWGVWVVILILTLL